MNGLIAWWARNTVAANLLMFGIMVAGLMAYFSMERELDPNVRFSGLVINTTWPGASPEEIEDQVVSRIEEALSDLDNVDFIRSYSGEGFGNLWMRSLTPTGFDRFMDDTKERVDAITNLPDGVERVQITQWQNNQQYFRMSLSGDIGEKELKHLADKIRKDVQALEHVSLVDQFGTRAEEFKIEITPETLERYNLTLTEVSNAIQRNSLNLSSGSIRTDSGQITLSTRTLAKTKEEFDQIVIRQTADGGTLKLADIATVIDGFEDEELLATVNGKPTVLINVISGETMQITKAAENIREYIDQKQSSLPDGVTLTIWEDNSVNFNSNLGLLLDSAGLGLILVLGVLFLTLRPVVALWVAVGVATAYLGAFIFLPTVDVSINFISMFSFLMVLGIVVDDAIIVGENIHSESGKSGGGLTSATLGTQLVAKPVIFGVLTSIIAFLPWIFISGDTSEFTRHITWVVVFALTFSLIESLLILPAHLSKMRPRKRLGFFSRIQKAIADGIVTMAEKLYRPIANWASEYRWLVLFSMIGIFIVAQAGLRGANYIEFQFDPNIEADQIEINVDMPDGSPYWRAEEILAQMQQAQDIFEKEVAASQQGDGGVKLIEFWYTRARASSILAIVKLPRPENRPIRTDGTSYTAKEAAVRLRELIGDIPDAEEVTVSYQRNNNGPGIQFAIAHRDPVILREATDELMEKLRTYDELYDVRDNMRGANQEMRFTLKPGAVKLGLSLSDVSRQVRQAYFGAEPMRILRDGEEMRVRVLFPQDVRRDPESLRQFRVITPTGERVPLESVAQVTFEQGISGVLRFERKRAVFVSADLKTKDAGPINEDLDKNFFPSFKERYPGVETEGIGQARGQARFFQELLFLNLIALFAMYAMLAIAFRSYWQPLLIMVAIPFAYIGALMGHLITDSPLTFFSFFGIAAAAGVVINDNLVMVDYCNKLREKGFSAKDAMVEAGVKRFRPILLTTVTTVVGLLPMLLERSQEAAFLQPLVVALAFGVLFDFFVTLLLVPAMYRVGIDIKAFWMKRIWGSLKWLFHLYFPPKRKDPAIAE